MIAQYPSRLLESAVKEISKLPGIGRKSALRMALHLLRQEQSSVESLTNALTTLRRDIHYCRVCHNISDTEQCEICSNPARDRSIVCVVESIRDVMAIENTRQFKGLYHVLGGVISPMEGIGPNTLAIEPLVERLSSGEIRELIFALGTTMEGDTTTYYIYRKIAHLSVVLSTIARGIAVGDEIEYADEITLGSSILNRILYRSE